MCSVHVSCVHTHMRPCTHVPAMYAHGTYVGICTPSGCMHEVWCMCVRHVHMCAEHEVCGRCVSDVRAACGATRTAHRWHARTHVLYMWACSTCVHSARHGHVCYVHVHGGYMCGPCTMWCVLFICLTCTRVVCACTCCVHMCVWCVLCVFGVCGVWGQSQQF